MRLWLLGRNQTKPEYDVVRGFVIRAENEIAARKLAAAKAGDEEAETWLKPLLSSCDELLAEGHSCIILRDYNAG